MLMPEVTAQVGSLALTLRPNARAWYGLERATGESFRTHCELFLRGRTVRPQCDLLWALSATDRAQNRNAINLTEAERLEHQPTPGEFLDCLPVPGGEQWNDLRNIITDLLIQSGIAEPKPVTEAKEPAQSPPA